MVCASSVPPGTLRRVQVLSEDSRTLADHTKGPVDVHGQSSMHRHRIPHLYRWSKSDGSHGLAHLTQAWFQLFSSIKMVHQTTHPSCPLQDKRLVSVIQGQGRPFVCNLGMQPGPKPMILGPVGLPTLLVTLRTWERLQQGIISATDPDQSAVIGVKGLFLNLQCLYSPDTKMLP